MRTQEQRPRLAGDANDRRTAALAGLALALECVEAEALAFVEKKAARSGSAGDTEGEGRDA